MTYNEKELMPDEIFVIANPTAEKTGFDFYAWKKRGAESVKYLREDTPAQPSEDKPCETCNGDDEVCASVPSLRHCEKANRDREEPSADVDYSDYIKRTPINITMAEMMINALNYNLGNQVYRDALEDHIKALQSTKMPENVRCDDLTNTNERVKELEEKLKIATEALYDLDEIYYSAEPNDVVVKSYGITQRALGQIEGGRGE